jgi:hypothetical protein
MKYRIELADIRNSIKTACRRVYCWQEKPAKSIAYENATHFHFGSCSAGAEHFDGGGEAPKRQKATLPAGDVAFACLAAGDAGEA